MYYSMFYFSKLNNILIKHLQGQLFYGEQKIDLFFDDFFLFILIGIEKEKKGKTLKINKEN